MASKPSKARSAVGVPKPTTDARFAAFQTDPRYRLPHRKHTHVKLDTRFASMLEDEDFSSRRKVDRYGRRLPDQKGKKELERLYDFAGDQESEDESGADDDEIEKELKRVNEEDDTVAGSKYVGFDESSSSEEDDESSSEEEESDVEEDAAVEAGLEGFAGDRAGDYATGEPSRRLAIQDLDWDHIRAVDLMAVAQSFCPVEGKIESISVYPSEFGKERMEREELEGPPKELFTKTSDQHPTRATEKTNGALQRRIGKQDKDLGSSSSEGSEEEFEDEGEDEELDDVEDDNSLDIPDDAALQKSILKHAKDQEPEVDTRALRAYQLTRLKYYYAILTCSSVSAAQAIYNFMDDTEYLSTANYFRLSFVPDDMTFDDKAHDECSKVPPGYRPAEFVTEALTHSKVRLTWDEEDRERKEAQKRAFQKNKQGQKGVDLNEDDLAAYVGSDSDSEEEVDGGVAIPIVDYSNTSNAQPKVTELTPAVDKRQQMRLALGLPLEDTGSAKSIKLKPRTKSADKPVGNMQVTFSSALSNPNTKAPTSGTNGVFENDPNDFKDETTREKYIRKEKDRKERRREKARAFREGADESVARSAPSATAPSKSFAKVTEDDVERGVDADAGFDDPFFADPTATNANAKKAAKKARREQKLRDAEIEDARKQKEREQLELLMAEDGGLGDWDFNIAAVRKAEKEASKKEKGKGKKKVKSSAADEAVQIGRDGDEFNVDVQDPRFRGVFEDFEYAIDPSNPRFSRTHGMKTLLEEGRKRRKDDEEVDDIGDESKFAKKAKKQDDSYHLVEKLKRRNVR